MNKTKVYVNGKLIGFHEKGEELRKELINKRRQGILSEQINIALHENTNELYINSDAGRVQRPLIIIENGKPKLKKEHINKIKEGSLNWKNLVKQGIIEFIDAEEEENLLIATKEEEITKDHTHLELNNLSILSAITGLIPFVEHNLATKALHGAKMISQGVGLPSINYNLRTDTEMHLMYYPQKPLVKTKIYDLMELERRPDSQNFVVALMPFYGFNMMDAVVINKGAVERGLARSTYYRTYSGVEMRYPGGQKDKVEIPKEEVEGFLGEEEYKELGEDGIIELERFVKRNGVIIGKTAPPRFLEEITEFGVAEEKRVESSIKIRKNIPGYVDKIFITENIDGHKLIKVKIRSEMIPEPGDKFASRHGQKGILGELIPEQDMPYTRDGIKPDLLLNPHGISSRMTVGHLLDTLAGKSASFTGEDFDGTPFKKSQEKEIKQKLKEYGFRNDGKEVLYNGITGEKLESEIFTGVISYKRLYHLVSQHIQARSRGPVQLLTRQPTEGKEKEGGLRFGEMEGESLVGHGAAMLLQEKLVLESDRTTELVCERCGLIAVNDKIRKKKYCQVCKNSKISEVEMSYGFKLLLDELKALGLIIKLKVK